MKFEKRGEITPEEQEKEQELMDAREQEDKSPKTMKKRQQAVLIYVAVMFIVALGLIVLSYFIQQRRTSDTINSLTEQHSQFSTQALQNIEELQNSNIELRDQLEEKEDEIERLTQELEDTKQQWADDVKSVTDEMKEDVNDQMLINSALEALLNARIALDDGDKDTAKTELALAEPLLDRLEAKWQEYYKTLIDRVD